MGLLIDHWVDKKILHYGINQGFSTLAWLKFGTGRFFVGAVLCTVGYSAASLAYTQ